MKTFLKARWENIIMVNYAIDASVLLGYLPYGTELDTFEGNAFVSLVGFRFVDSQIFGIPIPFFGSFDEVNLRFYVKRMNGSELRRGVVFVNELVPNPIVAFLANLLYKEHYTTAKMDSSIVIQNQSKEVSFAWKKDKKDYSIFAKMDDQASTIISGSLEEFIYEHYYGYTKVSSEETWEYRVNHPRWETNKINHFEINCDFGAMYGSDFEILNNKKPISVFHAIGSEVSIDREIIKIKNKHNETYKNK